MNSSFDRETRAVLEGKRIFEANRLAPSQTTSLLRRNTHRLEKGLLMRPRRDLFALDYLGETVEAYAHLVTEIEGSTPLQVEELAWAHDVLAEYFALTRAHPRTDRARAQFQTLPKPRPETTSRSIPYRSDSRDRKIPSFEGLLTLAKHRRSVRWFLDKPVPRDLILQALEVAAQAPSACNRQPFKIRFFDDPALVRKVARLPGGTRGFEHNFPSIAVVIGELRNYYSERDRHVIYIDSSLAVMGFTLALETLGLSSCCINWPDLPDSEAAAVDLLKLEPDQRPVMFIAIGYPDPEGLIAYSQKKSPRELCQFNFE